MQVCQSSIDILYFPLHAAALTSSAFVLTQGIHNDSVSPQASEAVKRDPSRQHASSSSFTAHSLMSLAAQLDFKLEIFTLGSESASIGESFVTLPTRLQSSILDLCCMSFLIVFGRHIKSAHRLRVSASAMLWSKNPLLKRQDFPWSSSQARSWAIEYFMTCQPFSYDKLVRWAGIIQDKSNLPTWSVNSSNRLFS